MPSDWREVTVGTLQFRFPRDRHLSGHDDLCGAPGAQPGDCVIFDEGPVLSHVSDGFMLQSRDDFGYSGPSAEELGSAISINGRKLHRARADDGTITYVVTAASGGPDSAALLWRKPTDALLWISCKEEAKCLLARRIVGSVEFDSAPEACASMEADRRRAAAKAGQSPPEPAGRCRPWL